MINYNLDVDTLILAVTIFNNEMPIKEYYDALKRLEYDFDRFNKFKNKYFYRELNYKRFINQAVNHLMYGLEQEEKQIINGLQYEINTIDKDKY